MTTYRELYSRCCVVAGVAIAGCSVQSDPALKATTSTVAPVERPTNIDRLEVAASGLQVGMLSNDVNTILTAKGLALLGVYNSHTHTDMWYGVDEKADATLNVVLGRYGKKANLLIEWKIVKDDSAGEE